MKHGSIVSWVELSHIYHKWALANDKLLNKVHFLPGTTTYFFMKGQMQQQHNTELRKTEMCCCYPSSINSLVLLHRSLPPQRTHKQVTRWLLHYFHTINNWCYGWTLYKRLIDGLLHCKEFAKIHTTLGTVVLDLDHPTTDVGRWSSAQR